MKAKDTHKGAKEMWAENHVFAELLKRGVLPYRTAGGCLRVNTPAGCRLELRVVASTGSGAGEERRFTVPDFRPRPELFFLCAELEEAEGSRVFGYCRQLSLFVYSDAMTKSDGLRELNLWTRSRSVTSDETYPYENTIAHASETAGSSLIQFDLYRRFMRPWGAPDFADGWEDFEDDDDGAGSY